MQQLQTPNKPVLRRHVGRDQLGNAYANWSSADIRAAYEKKEFDRTSARYEIAANKRARESASARLEGAQKFGIPSGCRAEQITAGAARLVPHPLYAIRAEYEWHPASGNSLLHNPMGSDKNQFYGSTYGRTIEANPLDTPRDVTIQGLLASRQPRAAINEQDLATRYMLRDRAITEHLEDTTTDAHAERIRQQELQKGIYEEEQAKVRKPTHSDANYDPRAYIHIPNGSDPYNYGPPPILDDNVPDSQARPRKRNRPPPPSTPGTPVAPPINQQLTFEEAKTPGDLQTPASQTSAYMNRKISESNILQSFMASHDGEPPPKAVKDIVKQSYTYVVRSPEDIDELYNKLDGIVKEYDLVVSRQDDLKRAGDSEAAKSLSPAKHEAIISYYAAHYALEQTAKSNKQLSPEINRRYNDRQKKPDAAREFNRKNRGRRLPLFSPANYLAKGGYRDDL